MDTIITDKYTLHHGDCLPIMQGMEAGSIDLAVTSPPYNVGIDYGGRGRDADRMQPEKYHEWAISVMKALFPIMKSGGRVCWEIGGDGRNIPSSYFWMDAAFKAGFGFFSQIGLQHRKTNPCAWGSWLKSDNVFTIPNFHQILVFYKDTATKRGDETTITKEEFTEWTRGYWNINYSIGSIKEHPAQYPEELPFRCIRLFGHKSDVVFDPFLGSGTTAIVAIKQERKFIGCELVEEYFDIAYRRIKQSEMQEPLFTT